MATAAVAGEGAVDPDTVVAPHAPERTDVTTRPRAFVRPLLAIATAGLVLRVVFALAVASDLPIGVDADYYYLTAKSLQRGDGYVLRPAEAMWPTTDDPTVTRPAGDHPPLHTLVLTSARYLGLTTWDQQRLFLATFASLGPVLVGLAGRRIGGDRVGLVAAAIAAVHPLWFQHAGFMSSEATYVVVAPAVLLAGLVAVDRRTTGAMATLGAMCGFAVLTRSESIIWFGVLGLPVALLSGRRLRLRSVLVVCLALTLVLGPWLAWMRSTYGTWSLSMNGGATIAIANCDRTYEGDRLGAVGCGFGWLATASTGVPEGLSATERKAAMDRNARELGVDYAWDHRDRLPVVAAARLGRTVGVYPFSEQVGFDRTIGAHPATQLAGLRLHLVLLVLAAAGAVLLVRRRRWRHLVVLGSGPVVSVVVGVLVYGATRMRLSAEPAIAVGAALGLVALVEHALRGRTPPQRRVPSTGAEP